MPTEQNDDVVEVEELDETGAVEAAEYAGKEMLVDAGDMELGVNDPDIGTVDDGVNDHRLSNAMADKYAPELPITHLKNPVNNKVFAATPDLMRRRDLVPCDERGKKVCDHRLF